MNRTYMQRVLILLCLQQISGMQIIAGSRENYPAVNAIFPAVKHYFFLQNVFKCCQKIVIYLFHLFTPSNLGVACQRHAKVGLLPKYPPITARFPPAKNFSYIPKILFIFPFYCLRYGSDSKPDMFKINYQVNLTCSVSKFGLCPRVPVHKRRKH